MSSILKAATQYVGRTVRTDLFKVSSWSAGGVVIRMVTSLVSIKVAASLIGPSGMALVGQFLNGVTLLSAFGTGYIGQGVTKFMAEYYQQPGKQASVIHHAGKITLIFSCVGTLIIILCAKPLGFFLLQSYAYTSIIVLLGTSVFLFSLNVLMTSILNGLKQFKRLVLVNIYSSVFGLFLSLFLVVVYGLYGALLNCVLSQSLILVITLVHVRKEPWVPEIFARKDVDWNLVKNLLGFTAMMATSAIMVPLGQMFIRNHIVRHLSLNDAGLWEALNRISATYLSVITISISTYYLPRLAEIHDRALLRKEIFDAAKMILPVLAFFIFLIFLAREPIILLLFTPGFISIKYLLGFQLIGDFLKIASWILAYLFWAKAITKGFIITEILFGSVIILLSVVGVNYLGLVGSVVGYAGSYLLYFLFLLFAFRSILRT